MKNYFNFREMTRKHWKTMLKGDNEIDEF